MFNIQLHCLAFRHDFFINKYSATISIFLYNLDPQLLSSCWNGKTLVNYTLTGGIDAGIFYSNGNTDTMTTCMKYCCEQHDCDLAFRINQGCYTVHCKNEEQCRVRKARPTQFIPQIAFKRPEVVFEKGLYFPLKYFIQFQDYGYVYKLWGFKTI